MLIITGGVGKKWMCLSVTMLCLVVLYVLGWLFNEEVTCKDVWQWFMLCVLC